MNFPLVRETIWWVRKKIAFHNFDISKLDQLPKKFIYYPIQYSPESSINTPSPFFIDQTRAIDAIRFSMPNDHALVLKEHPGVLEVRPLSFIRKLKKSGVIIIKSDVDSNEIIKKAALTISVTGINL